MVAKNTDVEIECSASLAPSIPEEECSGGGTVEVRFSNDDCGPPSASAPYKYCIEEDVKNTTLLNIPGSNTGYRLDFASSGLQGMAHVLFPNIIGNMKKYYFLKCFLYLCNR